MQKKAETVAGIRGSLFDHRTTVAATFGMGLIHLATWRIYFLRRTRADSTIERDNRAMERPHSRRWLAFDTLSISVKIPSHLENVRHDESRDATLDRGNRRPHSWRDGKQNNCRQRDSNFSSLLFFNAALWRSNGNSSFLSTPYAVLLNLQTLISEYNYRTFAQPLTTVSYPSIIFRRIIIQHASHYKYKFPAARAYRATWCDSL